YFCEGDSLDCELLSALQEATEMTQSVITLSPNPARDFVIIQIDPAFRRENELQVSILNSVGDVILHGNWNPWKKLEVDVRNLYDGIYFLNVHDERVMVVKKFVIIH
ncbi:MAG: T9SS type A sorting domain-containing protein, partial [Saprospiraceae bacterium]